MFKKNILVEFVGSAKEEYAKQVAYWDLGSYVCLTEAKKKFRDIYLSLPSGTF